MNTIRRRTLFNHTRGGGPPVIDTITRDILVQERDCSTGQTLSETGRFTADYGSMYILYIDFTFIGNNGDMSTGHLNNLACIGINPEAQNDTSVRAYLGDDNDNSNNNILIIPFVVVDQMKFDTTSLIGNNKMIIKMEYPTYTKKTKTRKSEDFGDFFPYGDITFTYNEYTFPKVSIWLNGQNICKDLVPISEALKQKCISFKSNTTSTLPDYIKYLFSPDEGYVEGDWDDIMGKLTITNIEGTNRFYGTYNEISHITQEGLTDDDFVKLTKK